MALEVLYIFLASFLLRRFLVGLDKFFPQLAQKTAPDLFWRPHFGQDFPD
jgi:hypothetical protein